MLVGELTATLTMDDAEFMGAIARAKSAFTGLSQEALGAGLQVGANFSRGIAAGISSGTGVIQAAARVAARAAKSAAEAELQVRSPSRVGMGIGANFGKGMAIGIEEMTKSVANAARVLAGAAAKNANGQYQMGPQVRQEARAGANGATDARLIQTANDGRPTVLMLNGRELARTTAEDNNQALGGRSRQLTLGYGG